MSEQNRQQKNHWTSTKIDDATKKINRDIYKRNRQAPIHIKLDDLAQIGTLKNYNCKKLILNYEEELPYETKKIIKYDEKNVNSKK